MADGKHVDGKLQINSYISQFAPLQKQALRRAFESLLDLPASKQKQILPEVLQFVGLGTPPNKDVAKKCDLSHEELTSFVAAARTLASFVGADETDDDIIAGLQESLQITADAAAVVRTLLTFLREDRGTLVALRDRQRIATETIPSFENIQISTDIRLKIEDGKIINRVPIVLATISTDAPNHFISFQLTTEDLNEIRASLDKAITAVSLAEEWIATANQETSA